MYSAGRYRGMQIYAVAFAQSNLGKCLFKNLSYVALNVGVSLFGRFIACNGRNRVNRHTHIHTQPSTVTLAAHARRELMRIALLHKYQIWCIYVYMFITHTLLYGWN